ncbi:PKD domain-containing protein [Nitrososphaera viennensis]|nr:PKD domain-containing protein [Nitrososphaera viennensis]
MKLAFPANLQLLIAGRNSAHKKKKAYLYKFDLSCVHRLPSVSKNSALVFGIIGAVAIALVVLYTVTLKLPGEKPKTFRVNADNFFKIRVGEEAPFVGVARDGVEPYRYTWNFGDGGVSQLQNATHVYTKEGSYTVTLVVTDAAGTVVDISNTVDVYPPDANFTRQDHLLDY